jgi:quinol monooxygenase YgiN
LQFEVLGPRDDDGRVLFYEVYNDDAAFKVHWEGPFVARVRAETKDMIIKLTVQSPKVMKHMNLSFFRRSLTRCGRLRSDQIDAPWCR